MPDGIKNAQAFTRVRALVTFVPKPPPMSYYRYMRKRVYVMHFFMCVSFSHGNVIVSLLLLPGV